MNDPTLKKIIQNANPTTINNTLKNALDPKKNGLADGFQTKVIDGFQKDVIDGFQKDIINPSQAIFNNIGDTLNSLGGGQVPTNTSSSDNNMSMYIILIGAVLVGMYAFLPNKQKPVNNKI